MNIFKEMRQRCNVEEESEELYQAMYDVMLPYLVDLQLCKITHVDVFDEDLQEVFFGTFRDLQKLHTQWGVGYWETLKQAGDPEEFEEWRFLKKAKAAFRNQWVTTYKRGKKRH